MRILLFISLACFVISLICVGVGITILTLNWAFWAVAGLLSWRLEALSGVVSVNK